MDLSQKIKGISLASKKSKAGNDYNTLDITFANGYTLSKYVNPEEAFIIGTLK